MEEFALTELPYETLLVDLLNFFNKQLPMTYDVVRDEKCSLAVTTI